MIWYGINYFIGVLTALDEKGILPFVALVVFLMVVLF